MDKKSDRQGPGLNRDPEEGCLGFHYLEDPPSLVVATLPTGMMGQLFFMTLRAIFQQCRL